MELTITSFRDFDSDRLRLIWRDLSLRSPHNSLFSTYEWCRCWVQHLGGRVQPRIWVFQNTEGHAVGLLPMGVETKGHTKWMKFLGRERSCGDHLDLLTLPDQHQACLNAAARKLEAEQDIDGLLFGELHHDSETRRWLMDWAKARGYAIQEREPREVPYVDLPASFDEYLASLSANMRYHIRRRRREFARNALCQCRLLTTPVEVLEGLEHLFDLHARRWARKDETGVMHAKDKQDFLKEFCTQAAATDRVRLYQIQAADGVQAALLAFHWLGTAYFYQMGWDADPRLQSPGVILLAASIQQAIREGLTRYDFLQGEEAYKRRWTTQSVQQTTLCIGISNSARVMLAAERLKNCVREAVTGTLGPAAWTGLRRTLGSRHA